MISRSSPEPSKRLNTPCRFAIRNNSSSYVLAGAYLQACRASRLDPTDALRQEQVPTVPPAFARDSIIAVPWNLRDFASLS